MNKQDKRISKEFEDMDENQSGLDTALNVFARSISYYSARKEQER